MRLTQTPKSFQFLAIWPDEVVPYVAGLGHPKGDGEVRIEDVGFRLIGEVVEGETTDKKRRARKIIALKQTIT